MNSIQTVSGRITRQDVKLVCIHEHLILDMTHEAVEPVAQNDRGLFYGCIQMENLGILRRNPYIVKENLILDDVEAAVREIKYVTEAGCNLIIDLTSEGLGRDAGKLKRINELSGCNIVMGCGLFVHDSRIGKYLNYDIESLAEWMMNDIENGVEGTGIKSGVIGEIGTSEIIYPIERNALVAAARVSAKTGLPIYIHTYPWSRAGLEAVDLVLSHSIAPNKICLCHLDVSFDYEYIKQALDRGIYIEFDNLGKEFFFEKQDGAFAGGPFETDHARVAMIKRLIIEGYEKQLLLANDLCLKISLHRFGGWGYDHLFTNFIPMMRYGGISEAEIDQLVKRNPLDFLFLN